MYRKKSHIQQYYYIDSNEEGAESGDNCGHISHTLSLLCKHRTMAGDDNSQHVSVSKDENKREKINARIGVKAIQFWNFKE